MMFEAIRDPIFVIWSVVSTTVLGLLAAYLKDYIDARFGESAQKRKVKLAALANNSHFAILATAEALFTALQFLIAAALLLLLLFWAITNRIPAELGLAWLIIIYMFLIALSGFVAYMAFQFVEQVSILNQAYKNYLQDEVLKSKTIGNSSNTKNGARNG